MPDFSELIGHWGYPAIVLFVILGNVGRVETLVLAGTAIGVILVLGRRVLRVVRTSRP